MSNNTSSPHKLPTIKEAQEKYSPKAYGNFIKQLELEKVLLTAMSAETTLDPDGNFPTIILQIKDKFVSKTLGKTPSILCTYNLTGKIGRKSVIKIKGVWNLLLLSPKIPMDDELYVLFHDINVKMIVFPYFRELVQSVVARMSLPPLTLPLIKRL